jgi:hypothetical protein
MLKKMLQRGNNEMGIFEKCRLSLEWNSLGLARTGISALSSAIASNRSLQEVCL